MRSSKISGRFLEDFCDFLGDSLGLQGTILAPKLQPKIDSKIDEKLDRFSIAIWPPNWTQNGVQFPTKNQCKNRSKNKLLPNPTHKVEMPAKPLKNHGFRIGSGWPSGSILHPFWVPILPSKSIQKSIDFLPYFSTEFYSKMGPPIWHQMSPKIHRFLNRFSAAILAPKWSPKGDPKSPGNLPESSRNLPEIFENRACTRIASPGAPSGPKGIPRWPQEPPWDASAGLW